MTLNSMEKRYLFQVDVTQAKGVMVWSVLAQDEHEALKLLMAGDQKCKLIFDQLQIVATDPPQYVGPDQRSSIRGKNV
jgi:tagatose-1,6-bisphosphate aldolase